MSANPRFGIGSIPPIAALSAVAAVALVGVVAVFVLLGQNGGNQPGASSGASTGAGSGASTGPDATSPSSDELATLRLSGGMTESYALDGISGDVSPTSTIIAAIWTETIDNVAAGYGDLITVSLGGPVFDGTQRTSAQGIVLSFGVSRMDAGGNDLFDHQWTSKAGECSVTMSTGAEITGSFECAGLTSQDGTTVDAEGTFGT